MNLPLVYLLYVVLSAVLTFWLGRTLHTHGRIFVCDAARGDEQLADAINDLLLVGFYLVNFAYVALALRYGTKPDSMAGAIEFLTTKVGLVSVILGGMHLLNLLGLSILRRVRATATAAPIE
jgi:hypothetical protein